MRTAKLLAVCVLLSLVAAVAIAQHEQGETQGMPPMGPPKEMKAIAFMEGDWTVDVKWRMGPETEWVESNATATVMNVLDGAAQHMVWKGTMMGMPYEGVQIHTYDREEKRYESIWIDNMGARSSHAAGQMEGKKLVLVGEDLHMGQPYWLRMTSEKRSNDEFFWTMEMSMDGGKSYFTSMEMVYRRKAS